MSVALALRHGVSATWCQIVDDLPRFERYVQQSGKGKEAKWKLERTTQDHSTKQRLLRERSAANAAQGATDRMHWLKEAKRIRELPCKNVTPYKEELWATLHQVSKDGNNAVPVNRRTQEFIAAAACLGEDESRARIANEREWVKRWGAMLDACALECPFIVAHPLRDAFIQRRAAEAARAQLEHNELLQRLQEIKEGRTNKKMLESLSAHAAVVTFEEEKSRLSMERKQKKEWQALSDEQEAALGVIQTHDLRKSVVVEERKRDEALAQKTAEQSCPASESRWECNMAQKTVLHLRGAGQSCVK